MSRRTSEEVSGSLFRGILARSLLVQASWNFKGMQNLGFATMTLPALKRLGREEGRAPSGAELLSQTEFFNTHPYLAGAVAGLTISNKLQAPSAEDFEGAQRESKETFMGVLGSLGDDYFWAALRPFAGTLGVALAMISYPFLGILLFMVIYNLFHFRVRAESLRHGLGGREKLLAYLEGADLHGRARLHREMTTILLMFLPIFWNEWRQNQWTLPIWAKVLAGSSAVIIYSSLLQRFDPRRAVLLTLAGALLLAILGGLLR